MAKDTPKKFNWNLIASLIGIWIGFLSLAIITKAPMFRILMPVVLLIALGYLVYFTICALKSGGIVEETANEPKIFPSKTSPIKTEEEIASSPNSTFTEKPPNTNSAPLDLS